MAKENRQCIDVADDRCGTCEFWPGDRKIVRGETDSLDCAGDIVKCTKRKLGRWAKSTGCNEYREWSMLWTDSGRPRVKDPDVLIVDTADGLCGSCEYWPGLRFVMGGSRRMLNCRAGAQACPKAHRSRSAESSGCNRYREWQTLDGWKEWQQSEYESESQPSRQARSITVPSRERNVGISQPIMNTTSGRTGPFASVSRLDNQFVNVKEYSSWMWSNWGSDQVNEQITALIFCLGMERDISLPAGKYHPSWAPLFSELQNDIQTEKYWKQIFLFMHAEYDIWREIKCKEELDVFAEPKTLAGEKSISQFIHSIFSHWDEPEVQLRVESFSSGVGTISIRTFGIKHPTWKPLIAETEQTVKQLRFWQKLYRLTSLEITV